MVEVNEIQADHSDLPEQGPVTITVADIQERVSSMKSWTAPGPDMVHTYWLKKLTALHERLAAQMNQLLVDERHSEWLTEGKTVLILKDPQKGPVPLQFSTGHRSFLLTWRPSQLLLFFLRPPRWTTGWPVAQLNCCGCSGNNVIRTRPAWLLPLAFDNLQPHHLCFWGHLVRCMQSRGNLFCETGDKTLHFIPIFCMRPVTPCGVFHRNLCPRAPRVSTTPDQDPKETPAAQGHQ
ncbi:uncharacterized protein LOC112848110 [Oreochromis niloticus]|uniref:uncharacterized protein LOC112848110 n=1 Tax=Oreochromis niloticus TaxID=8128 RepID=UPI000DF48A12|nr:uncharacterized protein LOC112848110 [Oreochromis niloticus]